MSKNPSDKKPMPGEDEERKSDNQPTTEDWKKKQQEQNRQGESMARKQEGQKFVSDEDIIRRRTA
jgi:hypothetical protein